MSSTNLSLTVDQVKALLKIIQHQLLYVKYLDPRIPGYIALPGELEAAESAVHVLEALSKKIG